MNVFVLCTGRCGSLTFIRACSHLGNYSAAHESRVGAVGAHRLDFPPRHIEADNRLSWFLGRLDRTWGDRAFYVHLLRDPDAVARSFVRRFDRGIMRAYHQDGILRKLPPGITPYEVALDYCDTVNSNIESFLKDKTHWLRIRLEDASSVFPEFCRRIGAEGDLAAACAEFDYRHNASAPADSTAQRAAR